MGLTLLERLRQAAKAEQTSAGRCADERWLDLQRGHELMGELLNEAADKIESPTIHYFNGKKVIKAYGTEWIDRKELRAANERANAFEDELAKLKNKP